MRPAKIFSRARALVPNPTRPWRNISGGGEQFSKLRKAPTTRKGETERSNHELSDHFCSEACLPLPIHLSVWVFSVWSVPSVVQNPFFYFRNSMALGSDALSRQANESKD